MQTFQFINIFTGKEEETLFIMGDLTKPGAIQFTRILRGANSIANALVIACMAPFVRAYPTFAADPTNP